MKTPHKHAELIKAWADGATIQYQTGDRVWYDREGTPSWNVETAYRIKPEPDIVEYALLKMNGDYDAPLRACFANLKVTFDGETGQLKAVELI